MYNSIEFSSVIKGYRNPHFLPWRSKKTLALDNATFDCPEGKLSCILGPNGAGKTTIIKIIAGLIFHDQGKIKINGEELRADSNDLHRIIGVMTPNDRSFYWRLTGRQNLDFFCTLNGFYGNEKREMLESIFEELEFTENSDKPYRHYSSGMKQKMLLARAIIGNPKILLLDEPTSHLDPIAKQHLYELIERVFIRKKKMTILLCTHDLSEAEKLADHIILLNRGRVLQQGSYSSLASLFKGEIALDLEFSGRYSKKMFDGIGSGIEKMAAGTVRIYLNNREEIPGVIKTLSNRGCGIISCTPVKESLLDIYTRLAGGSI